MTGSVETAGIARPRGVKLDGRFFSRYGALIALLVLMLFNLAVTPNFWHLQTLYVNLNQVSTVAIVAIGMSLVIATGGIDLSVGAVMALAGALAPLIFLSEFGRANPQIALVLAFIVPVAAAALCGGFNGWLVSYLRIQPIIATLILFISGRGIAQVLTNGNLQTFSNASFSFIGTGRVFGIPVPALLVLVLAVVAFWLVNRSLYGRYLLAIGGNETAATLTGAPVKAVKIATYMISAGLAGLAGLISISMISASDAAQNGQLMELDAIAAAVVGGAVLAGGNAPILGVLLGAAIIQLVEYTLLANGVPEPVALIAKAGIIVAAVYVQQTRKE